MVMEGHSSNYEMESWLLHAEEVFGSRASTVCEVGFNAGHSAAAWLCAQPTATYLGFDMMRFEVSFAARAFLESQFPGRMHIVAGNTLDTLPAEVRNRADAPDKLCDIISIDGGHKSYIARSDLSNMHMLANPTKNYLVMDDLRCAFMSCPMQTRVWDDEFRARNRVTERGCAKSYANHIQGSTSDLKKRTPYITKEKFTV